MPTHTVNDIVTQAKVGFPDLSDTQAIRYLNIVRREVHTLLDIRQSANTINVTAGDPDYVVSTAAAGIQSVEYRVSATQRYKLNYVSVDELDADRPGWRGETRRGVPREYTLIRNNTGQLEVHLLAVPDTTTTGGYPILYVYIDITADVASGETFYDDVPNSEVLIAGIHKLWARDKHIGQYEGRNKLYLDALKRASDYIRNFNSEGPTKLVPTWIQ